MSMSRRGTSEHGLQKLPRQTGNYGSGNLLFCSARNWCIRWVDAQSDIFHSAVNDCTSIKLRGWKWLMYVQSLDNAYKSCAIIYVVLRWMLFYIGVPASFGIMQIFSFKFFLLCSLGGDKALSGIISNTNNREISGANATEVLRYCFCANDICGGRI